MSTADEIVAQIDRLASLPESYLRVKRVLDDPNGTTAQLVEAMMTDTAMTARVLRIVNSPFFGFPGRVETVTRAVSVLGMQQVHDMVLAWAISSAFTDLRPPGISMKEFWRKSVARAIAARLLARHARLIDAGRLFVEGLLSDIGHLVMFTQIPDLAIQAMDLHKRSNRPLHECEREIIGCDYAQVGAALVSAWQLPPTFNEPIACQIEPSAAIVHRLEACILHVAGTLAQSVSGVPDPPPDEGALVILALDDATLNDLQSQVSVELDGVVAAFFPSSA